MRPSANGIDGKPKPLGERGFPGPGSIVGVDDSHEGACALYHNPDRQAMSTTVVIHCFDIRDGQTTPAAWDV
ncbi:hypothetical protein [Mycolicibacterium parafortuitum]|uniref:hypothetical protein n=1 Tax=Mycolicibacterium parafortuitum TaxID=39692 RepID=UPI0010552EC0|nr:hypothetical protein [Mycolicibacterium parafortuitum]